MRACVKGNPASCAITTLAREVLLRQTVCNAHLIADLALVVASLALMSCADDRPYVFQSAPGEKSFPVEVAEAENLTSIESDVDSPSGVQARVLCETCHSFVDIGTPAKRPQDLVMFHQGLTFTHGQLACASCHESGKPLLLHLATGEELPMERAMSICSQCHGPQRRSFDHGTHGGMNGYWDLSRGPRLRNQCVQCHDPHSPQIPKVEPALPPRDRGKLPQTSVSGGTH
jgi:hypothetical protein